MLRRRPARSRTPRWRRAGRARGRGISSVRPKVWSVGPARRGPPRHAGRGRLRRAARAVDVPGGDGPASWHGRHSGTRRLVRSGIGRGWQTRPMSKVAFLGMGTMGAPMARHLRRAGHEVVVYNRTASKALAWVALNGGAAAPTPAETAEEADVVALCVGNDDDVREVTTGPNGAIAGMRPGAILVDHTTASAGLARELSAACRERGLRVRRCAGVRWPGGGGERAAHHHVWLRRRRRVRRGEGGDSTPTPSRACGSALPVRAS